MPSLSIFAARPAPVGPTVAPRAPGRPSTGGAVFLLVILAAQLMVVLDTTIVNVALPHIAGGLHLSSSGLSWVLNAYLLTFGGLLMLGARAGDLIGRRRTFLVGIAVFSASSLVGGFATVGGMLLAARALQGVGAALAAPSSLALLTSAFPEGPPRVRAIGLFTTVSAAGGAIGLVAGGILTELVSWRWVMFVNVPIGLLVLLVGGRILPETERRHGRFDLAGAALSVLGMTAVVLGLVEAGTAGWTSPVTVSALAAGAALLVALVRLERRVEEPILPLGLFTDATRTSANVSRGLVYAAMYGMFFFLGQFLQDVRGYSPLVAGVSFLPVPVSVFLSSQLASKVLLNRVRPKLLMITGIGLVITSLVLCGDVPATVGYPRILVALVLLGMGSGTSLVTLTSASLAGVDPADAGAASGLVNVVQQVGAALGLAVLVTVFSFVTGRARLDPAAAGPAVHGVDSVLRVAGLFAVAALVLVVAVVRLPPPAPSERAVSGRAGAEPCVDETEALALEGSELVA